MRLRQRGLRAGFIVGQFALCAALLGGPCGGKDAPTEPGVRPDTTDQILVTVTSYNPRVGETVHIGAERVSRTQQPVLPRVPCTFAPSSDLLVSMNGSGSVTALAQGLVTITVRCGGLSTVVTLTIRPQLVALTVTMLGTGTGSVFVSPAQGPYDAGTTVTLTARPLSVQPGASVFTGWGGACAGTATTCVLLLAANTVVTATFTPGFVLRLLTTGSGSGGITATPSEQTYAAGTAVKLDATAYDGSGFAGWSGDCAGIVSPCNLVMNADRTVTGQFEKVTKLSTDYWGAFERVTNYDGCAWDPELAGSLAASYFVRSDGTVGGTATATVNITYTSPTGCAATPSSFTNAANIQGTAAALTWTNIGAQGFSMVFNGTLTNPNRIDGGAVATRTFQGSGPSGTKVNVVRAQLPGMYLTP